MNGSAPSSLLLILLAMVPLGAQQSPPRRFIPIRIVTQLGVIDAELDSARAPNTVVNFLRYVDGHAYDGGSFYRAVRMTNQPTDSVRIEVIQGGMPRGGMAKSSAIPLERTSVTGLHHRDGTLSMARGGPDTATDAFFITIGDQPSLDYGGKRNPDGQGFAAFGTLTSGRDVVRTIQEQPVKGQALAAPVAIIRIERR
ncbi:MAG: peptidylprolyl isomerase [Gemmatimonadota bacterium]|nr:peptidylprolyl isomerase [Gemmatimonadota bacterium]